MTYKQVQDFFNFDGVRRVTRRKEVFTLIDNLNKAPIHRENAHDEVKVNRLSSVTHHKPTDTFTLRIDPALKPFLLQLEAFFTEYYFKYISQLDLSSSFRLYELFKSYFGKKGIVEKIYSLEELKFLLGLEGKYQKFYEFKRWVLHPSLKEIEKFTDIKASYIIYEKKGKTVTHIKFLIQANSTNHKSASLPETFRKAVNQAEQGNVDTNDPLLSHALYRDMEQFDVAPNKKVKQIIANAEIDESYAAYIRDTIKRCQKDIARNPYIQNKAGYLLSAIDNDIHKEQRGQEDKIERQEKMAKAAKAEIAKQKEEEERNKAELYEKRRPLLQKLRAEHLNDELVRHVLASRVKNSMIREKLWAGYKSVKKSKILEAWVDEYLMDNFE